MKKMIIFTIICSLSVALIAQNTNVNEELSSLKKQVSGLVAKNAALEKTLNKVKSSSQSAQDSLIRLVSENNMKLKTVQDSLTAKAAELNAVQLRTGLFFHSLNLRKTVFFILGPLLVLVLILLYWMLSRKMNMLFDKNETLAINIKRSLEEDAANSKKDFQMQLSTQKEYFEKKLVENKKMV